MTYLMFKFITSPTILRVLLIALVLLNALAFGRGPTIAVSYQTWFQGSSDFLLFTVTSSSLVPMGLRVCALY